MSVRTTFAFSVFVCLCASLPTVGQARPQDSDIPSRPVRSFNIRDLNMIDALLQLGREQQIPMGIEDIDATAFRSRITLHAQDTTVGRLLDTITHAQGYSWLPEGNVVTLTHNGALQGRKNLLNLRISEFTIKREVTLQAASQLLLGKLYSVQHPHPTGIVGDYPSGNPQFRVGPWTMRNAVVRQI